MRDSLYLVLGSPYRFHNILIRTLTFCNRSRHDEVGSLRDKAITGAKPVAIIIGGSKSHVTPSIEDADS